MHHDTSRLSELVLNSAHKHTNEETVLVTKAFHDHVCNFAVQEGLWKPLVEPFESLRIMENAVNNENNFDDIASINPEIMTKTFFKKSKTINMAAQEDYT